MEKIHQRESDSFLSSHYWRIWRCCFQRGERNTNSSACNWLRAPPSMFWSRSGLFYLMGVVLCAHPGQKQASINILIHEVTSPTFSAWISHWLERSSSILDGLATCRTKWCPKWRWHHFWGGQVFSWIFVVLHASAPPTGVCIQLIFLRKAFGFGRWPIKSRAICISSHLSSYWIAKVVVSAKRLLKASTLHLLFEPMTCLRKHRPA